MQYIGLTGALSSGKLGGLVGSRGRCGQQFRARIVPRQARTAAASQAQAITGGLPAMWRKLTPAEQSTWADLATAIPARDALGQSITLSGYALYVACNRRLITIGVTEPLRAAPPASSVPPIYGFAATPVYSAPAPTSILTDITLTTAAPLPANFMPVLRASPAVAATRQNIRPSNLRVIQAGVLWPSEPYGVLALWQAIYGTIPPGGTITFELSLIDPATGLVGAPVRAATTFRFVPRPTPRPGTVTVEVEGTPIATIDDTWFEVEGNIVTN